jgi:hypothetical protein
LRQAAPAPIATGRLAGTGTVMVRETKQGEGTMRAALLAALFSLAAGAADATTQRFMQGWDEFNGQLDYANSGVTWTLNAATRDFRVTTTLVGAKPNFLYQVGIHFACTTNPRLFGRFPSGTSCNTITRQGVTATGTAAEFGVVLTDANGAGTFTVDVGAIASGTYFLEFDVRDGAGCNLIGGANACNVIFQSPGPFGTPTRLVVP